jgi:8-oxo-dGTP pyrophosphatase MutT (NUDIX family)
MTAPVHYAATVVLMRETGEVLLVLRHGRHGFMANVWVFPGGRVDDTDGVMPAPGAVQVERAPALRQAALRETWEEAGILLGVPPRSAQPGEARSPEHIDRLSSYTEIEPFARWVTPPSEKKRFDTVFYLAVVPPIAASPDQDEVVEALWIRPEDGIARHEGRGLPLPLAPPTLATLHALAHLATPEAALAWARARRDAGMEALMPELRLAEGRVVVALEEGQAFPLPHLRCRIIALVDGHWVLEKEG